MPLDFKTSSTNCAYFWHFLFWIIIFIFKPTKRKSAFIELTSFKSLFLSKVPSFYVGWKPTFARKTFLWKRLWKPWCYKCKICTMFFCSQYCSWARSHRGRHCDCGWFVCTTRASDLQNTKKGGEGSKYGSRRGDPNLGCVFNCVFNVTTACLCLSI